MLPPKKKSEAPKRLEEVRERVLLLVRGGNTLSTALSACGIRRQRLHEWRAAAAAGKRNKYTLFLEEAQKASDEGEVNDVITTARAANLDHKPVACERCGHRYAITTDEMLQLAGEMGAAQKVKESAAMVAFQRLALRNPQHWSPRVVHTIDDQLNEFLDVAQGLLEPEVFRALCSAYLARRESPPAPAARGPKSGPNSVH